MHKLFKNVQKRGIKKNSFFVIFTQFKDYITMKWVVSKLLVYDEEKMYQIIFKRLRTMVSVQEGRGWINLWITWKMINFERSAAALCKPASLLHYPQFYYIVGLFFAKEVSETTTWLEWV